MSCLDAYKHDLKIFLKYKDIQEVMKSFIKVTFHYIHGEYRLIWINGVGLLRTGKHAKHVKTVNSYGMLFLRKSICKYMYIIWPIKSIL